MDTDEVYELNPVSGAFWEAIDTHDGDAQRIFSDLRNRYEVEDDRLKEDLEKLITFLVSEGLLNAE
nr:PqqD family protein [Gymnodinialimonas phycosphaerae]